MYNKMKLTLLILLMIINVVLLQGLAKENQEVEVPFTAELPVVLTNPGQAPEYAALVILSQRINIPIEFDLHLHADGLEGFKTLIMIIGGSGKGLGSAGVNIDDEIKRAEELFETAQEQEIKIIGMHLGGEERRGPNSDVMINAITPMCDYIIVKAGGDYDGKFTKICEENDIPLTKIEKSLDLLDYLDALFRMENN